MAALTSGRAFAPAPAAVAAPAHAAAAATPCDLFAAAARAELLPPAPQQQHAAPPSVLPSAAALCATRAVLQLPSVHISYDHIVHRWPWLPGVGPPRARTAHALASAEAVERAVRSAIANAFLDARTDAVLWAVAMDCGTVRWVSDNVTAALGYAPAALVGTPYMAAANMEDNINYLAELALLLESTGDMRCFPRRLFRRRHAFGHEVLVSCAGSTFVQCPRTGELIGLVANRVVAALR